MRCGLLASSYVYLMNPGQVSARNENVPKRSQHWQDRAKRREDCVVLPARPFQFRFD